MLNYLHTAKRELAKHFPDCRMTVHKQADYSCGDDYLVLSVWSHWDVEESMARMDAFDNGWFLDNPPPPQSGLVIIERFQLDDTPTHPDAHYTDAAQLATYRQERKRANG